MEFWILSLILFVQIYTSMGSGYYYKENDINYKVYYGPCPRPNYKEFKAPKSYKLNYEDRGERPGKCIVGNFGCITPYSTEETKSFECELDYQCPRYFKCCQNRCFRHKICQPTTMNEEENINASTTAKQTTEISTPTTTSISTYSTSIPSSLSSTWPTMPGFFTTTTKRSENIEISTSITTTTESSTYETTLSTQETISFSTKNTAEASSTEQVSQTSQFTDEPSTTSNKHTTIEIDTSTTTTNTVPWTVSTTSLNPSTSIATTISHPSDSTTVTTESLTSSTLPSSSFISTSLSTIGQSSDTTTKLSQSSSSSSSTDSQMTDITSDDEDLGFSGDSELSTTSFEPETSTVINNSYTTSFTIPTQAQMTDVTETISNDGDLDFSEDFEVDTTSFKPKISTVVGDSDTTPFTTSTPTSIESKSTLRVDTDIPSTTETSLINDTTTTSQETTIKSTESNEYVSETISYPTTTGTSIYSDISEAVSLTTFTKAIPTTSIHPPVGTLSTIQSTDKFSIITTESYSTENVSESTSATDITQTELESLSSSTTEKEDIQITDITSDDEDLVFSGDSETTTSFKPETSTVIQTSSTTPFITPTHTSVVDISTSKVDTDVPSSTEKLLNQVTSPVTQETTIKPNETFTSKSDSSINDVSSTTPFTIFTRTSQNTDTPKETSWATSTTTPISKPTENVSVSTVLFTTESSDKLSTLGSTDSYSTSVITNPASTSATYSTQTEISSSSPTTSSSTTMKQWSEITDITSDDEDLVFSGDSELTTSLKPDISTDIDTSNTTLLTPTNIPEVDKSTEETTEISLGNITDFTLASSTTEFDTTLKYSGTPEETNFSLTTKSIVSDRTEAPTSQSIEKLITSTSHLSSTTKSRSSVSTESSTTQSTDRLMTSESDKVTEENSLPSTTKSSKSRVSVITESSASTSSDKLITSRSDKTTFQDITDDEDLVFSGDKPSAEDLKLSTLVSQSETDSIVIEKDLTVTEVPMTTPRVTTDSVEAFIDTMNNVLETNNLTVLRKLPLYAEEYKAGVDEQVTTKRLIVEVEN